MANKILVKRSAVAAKVPLTTDLDLGEFGVNTYDGKVYIKKNDGAESIVRIGGAEYFNQEGTPTPDDLGAIWYKPSTAKTYIWANDGSNDVWVDISTVNSTDILPDQTGNSGKVLTTDGTNAAWAVMSGMEYYNQEATPTPTDIGAIWYVPSTSKTYIYINDGVNDLWIDISGVASGDTLPAQSGQGGKILSTDGTTASWIANSASIEYYNQEATPTPSSTGALWYVPSTSKTYIYVNDGSNDVWIDISGVSSVDTLPAQSGQGGKVLSTDGTNASWIVSPSSEFYNQEATPTPSALGAIWYVPSTDKTYLYVNDGSNDIWIER